MRPPVLFFIINIVFAILGSFYFHMNFRISLSLLKMPFGIYFVPTKDLLEFSQVNSQVYLVWIEKFYKSPQIVSVHISSPSEV